MSGQIKLSSVSYAYRISKESDRKNLLIFSARRKATGDSKTMTNKTKDLFIANVVIFILVS
ncbi:CLUMA_CG011270, isoform A [Clunio marinus]|uniref:CLUMA_CG011270, isoform A n=1 Tax=Clunio marinus TaxID=568069 RepID=A0A1J1IC78_9DIPT|nr:CLUMA_CG011270, isoform A [Clunio marinus]